MISPGVVISVIGFVLIGMVCTACIVFGVYEIARNDAIFSNAGFGEVLTVLGMYFTIPYLGIIAATVFMVVRLPRCCSAVTDLIAPKRRTAVHIFVLLLVLAQQAVADAYLVEFLGYWPLFLVAFDIAVVAAMVYMQFSQVAGIFYTAVVGAKIALLWNWADQAELEPTLKPNGIIALNFMTIPIVQLPLYASFFEEDDASVVDVFVGNFNLFLSHLLHSLDFMSMYNEALLGVRDYARHYRIPTPFKWLLCFFAVAAFLCNNTSLLHLFYRRRGITDVEISFLPKRFKEATRRAEQIDDTGDAAARSQHRRMFQYFLLMMAVCDVPFLLCRIQLWYRNYSPLDLFVAKNIKDIVDVAMLLLRTNKQREQLGFE